MAKYLLFVATYQIAQVSSVIHSKISQILKTSGDVKNIVFWNWTPTQKGLFDADISRVIMKSHWSTGKTRIMLEKAKKLALNGENVLFCLYYCQSDFDFAPILLYHSLYNEIEKFSKTSGRRVGTITLELTKSIDHLSFSIKKNMHVFIDEFVINDESDLRRIDIISKKVADTSCMWVTLSKAKRGVQSIEHLGNMSKLLEKWLNQKIEEGFIVPTLRYALRNSKEIVDLDNSLNSLSSNTPKTQDVNMPGGCEPFTLPSLNWPSNGLEDVTHGYVGYKPIIEKHNLNSKALKDVISQCFQKLPNQRVLVIVFAVKVPSEITDTITDVRGCRPLVVDNSNEMISGYQMEPEQIEFREWLVDPKISQDVIASSSVISGFEWPSVLLITGEGHSEFHVRNMIMRAMVNLVWLQTNFLTDVFEIPRYYSTRD